MNSSSSEGFYSRSQSMCEVRCHLEIIFTGHVRIVIFFLSSVMFSLWRYWYGQNATISAGRVHDFTSTSLIGQRWWGEVIGNASTARRVSCLWQKWDDFSKPDIDSDCWRITSGQHLDISFSDVIGEDSIGVISTHHGLCMDYVHSRVSQTEWPENFRALSSSLRPCRWSISDKEVGSKTLAA